MLTIEKHHAYVCAGVCEKGVRADPAHYCQE